MKLQNELQPILDKINALEGFQDSLNKYAKNLKESGNYKNFENRLANDLLRNFVSSATICEWYKKYNCDDTHVTSLAKKILKNFYTVL